MFTFGNRTDGEDFHFYTATGKNDHFMHAKRETGLAFGSTV